MYVIVFFFFKQKTAYEMRISDWSSDVCSSDLLLELGRDMRDAIRIALAVALPIFLMIVFGRPETVGKLDRGDDRLRPFRLIAFDRGQRGVMLHLILREDRRAILRADIIALPDRKSTRQNSSH